MALLHVSALPFMISSEVPSEPKLLEDTQPGMLRNQCFFALLFFQRNGALHYGTLQNPDTLTICQQSCSWLSLSWGFVFIFNMGRGRRRAHSPTTRNYAVVPGVAITHAASQLPMCDGIAPRRPPALFDQQRVPLEPKLLEETQPGKYEKPGFRGFLLNNQKCDLHYGIFAILDAYNDMNKARKKPRRQASTVDQKRPCDTFIGLLNLGVKGYPSQNFRALPQFF